jgi:hypothetical protein
MPGWIEDKPVTIIAAPAPQRGGKASKTAFTGRKRNRRPVSQLNKRAPFKALLKDILSLFDRLRGRLRP